MNPTVALIEPEVHELLAAGAYADLREVLHGLPPADVADILAALPPDQEAIAFRVLPRDDAAVVFSYLEQSRQEELIQRLGDAGAVRIVEAMEVDDRARLLDELPQEVAARIVASLSAEDRKTTQAILGYPPRSVGRLMTPDYVRIRPEWTVARALDHIRRSGRDAETINVVYVVDDQGVLIDDVRLRQLIMAEPDATVESLLNHQFIALKADQPQEEAVEALQKYDRVALPVLDSRGALLGIVTHDDLADVAQEIATEQIQSIGAVQALEEPFIQTSVLGLVSKRAPWLALLFLSELLTSNAIAFFEDEIQRAAILAIFIPAIISSGGNAGSQASTLVIRALGLKEIRLNDWFRVLRRELAVAALLGLLIGLIGVVRINLFGAMGWFRDPNVLDHYVILGWTIGFTLLGVVVWGSIMGAMLPFLLKRLGFDPAGSSTPFVATLVDVTGIVIYFTVAMLMLRATLLNPDAPDTHLRIDAPVTVVSSDDFRPGDREVTLLVRSDADPQSAPPRRVIIPTRALPDAKPPSPRSRLRLRFLSSKAEDAAPLPDPAPGSQP
ncbi:MAG: magnesium transporter [Phycisphaerae bacterium]|nr:magnesium transporter [Phycisphaerae bacterium]